MEYNIGNRYIIIMKYTVKTNDPYQINRIEIAKIEGTTKRGWLKLDNGKYVKAALVTKLIDIDNTASQWVLDELEMALI